MLTIVLCCPSPNLWQSQYAEAVCRSLHSLLMWLKILEKSGWVEKEDAGHKVVGLNLSARKIFLSLEYHLTDVTGSQEIKELGVRLCLKM